MDPASGNLYGEDWRSSHRDGRYLGAAAYVENENRRAWSRHCKEATARSVDQETPERKSRSDRMAPRKRRDIGDDDLVQPGAAALRPNEASDADVGARPVG